MEERKNKKYARIFQIKSCIFYLKLGCSVLKIYKYLKVLMPKQQSKAIFTNSLLTFAFYIILSLLFFIQQSPAESSRLIIPRSCDFYGVEESNNALAVGSVITAKDPDGITIGQSTITTTGKYGFLSTRADDPNTPEDEGAVAGDSITFYIDGTKQQKQAIWKSAATIQVDLGVPILENTFNLHLLDMPGYTNYQGDPNYSAAAVADMIIDYLVPANTDTQVNLMSFADFNQDKVLSSSELERLLNQKVGGAYFFGSTATIKQYYNWGLIDKFDSTNQADCIKQICHWLAYKVPNTTVGREYVPVAVSTSANPSAKADSDYSHWMSVVGIKTNQDPFPSLSKTASAREEFRVSDSLQLYGVYLNDPGQSGLGFHTYMSADIWTIQYFRPIAQGLEGAGSYAAIMEPPDPKAASVKVTPAKNNNNLQAVLEIPEKGISVFIPKALNKEVKDYLISLIKQFKQSRDFTTLIEDPYFGEALKNTEVNRCFKVSGKLNQDYTILPFEKKIGYKLTTTLAVLVNNQTGQFQIASADNKATSIYKPMPFYQAYMYLIKKIGFSEYLFKYWQSNNSGNPLFPGWAILTNKYTQQGPIQIISSNEYAITSTGKVTLEQSSPGVTILSTKIIRSGREWVKMISFKINTKEKYTVAVDAKTQRGKASLLQNQDTWLLILRGQQDSSCKLEVKSTYSTQVYIRR